MTDSPADSAPIRPRQMHLDRQKGLSITWSDGRQSFYPLTHLRRKCPCATCRDGGAKNDVARPQAGGASLTVLPQGFDRRASARGAALVGNYAIQIEWADGHNTGIYDFEYLRSIEPESSGAV